MNSILEDFKQAFRTGNILNQLIVINVVVFLVLLVVRLFLNFGGGDDILITLDSIFSFDPRLERLIYRPWTVVLYGFTHYGVMHILFNMLFLYWFGRIITSFLGQHKLLGLYVIGVISGALLYFLLYNLFPRVEYLGGTNPMMIGASAGVYAVMVGASTFQPNYTFNLILIGPIKIKYITAFYIILSIAGADGGNSGGNIAHLGGALMGYIVITQLQKGNDWSKSIVAFVAWAKGLFDRKPRMNVSYKNKESAKKKTWKSKGSNSAAAAKHAPTPQAEIDSILDKISEKGYDALSKEEKQKLFNASKD